MNEGIMIKNVELKEKMTTEKEREVGMREENRNERKWGKNIIMQATLHTYTRY